MNAGKARVYSLFPDEAQIASAFLGVAGCVGYYYILKMLLPDQFEQSKKKTIEDVENEGQKMKRFSDVGGCEQAKEAILEIIDYIKAPQDY